MSSTIAGSKVGIVMPVLNEVGVIEKTIKAILVELSDVHLTLCIVDDGSTDGTLLIIENLQREYPSIVLIKRKKEGRGCQRGAASRIGLQHLMSLEGIQLFVEIDADGAQPPAELRDGLVCVFNKDTEIVIASKYLVGSKVIGRPFLRQIASWSMSALLRLLVSSRIRDYSNSYRFFNRRSAELVLRYNPQYTTPLYLLEMLLLWIANDHTIKELPTFYSEDPTSSSKVTFLDLFNGLVGLFYLVSKFYLGHFRLKTNEL